MYEFHTLVMHRLCNHGLGLTSTLHKISFLECHCIHLEFLSYY
jgi:hypothetical protein